MRTLLALSLCALGAGCRSGASYDGLAPAQATGGPTVRFDLMHKPLPEIPFPNDIATRPDPDSPTGLRLNAALIAPTGLESNLRAQLDGLDGFGTYAPISVAFDRDLDVLDLYARQNDQDPANDGVLLIDLADGKRWPLDVNGGHFPYELPDPAPYFLNDPLASVTNLLFAIDSAAPFGPNFLHPQQPDADYRAAHGGVPQASDDLLGFYERATHTLIVRPVLPLPQEHRFAVVITKRVRGTDGNAVTSPFSGINHTLQTSELSALPRLLPAGTTLADVAFTWAFTTQTITRDLERIHDGLYGIGPLRNLSLQFPVQVSTTDAAHPNSYATRMTILPVDSSNALNPFILTSDRFQQILRNPGIAGLFFSGGQAELNALTDTFQYVDYLVFGSYVSPDLLADRDRAPNDATFQIDYKSGATRAQVATVPFVIAVPRTNAARAKTPPFPVAILGHGYRSNRFEGIVGFAGTLAKFGIASVSIDAYGHGLGLPAQTTGPSSLLSEQAVRDQLSAMPGLAPLAAAVLQTRARDLDNDGIKDPGGDFWTADAFHTRDVIRQSIVDWMQLSRLLRTFDGQGEMLLGDITTGTAALAGDFNQDGVPDLAGPLHWPTTVLAQNDPSHTTFGAPEPNRGSDQFVFGISLGGILSGILPAVEPNIRAAAPVSGAGGLADVGIRSDESSVKAAVYLEMFGPILATCSWSVQRGACSAGAPDAQPSLVWEAPDVNRDASVPVTPLSLSPGDTLIACDTVQVQPGLPPDAELAHAQALPAGCKSAVADASGNVRISLGADAPQLFTTETGADAGVAPVVNVQVVQPGDPIHLVVVKGATVSAVDAFGYSTSFYGVSYPQGSPLRAVSRGFGYERNTPGFRRMWAIAQIALEPGDPVNYAAHWFNDLLPARTGLPANVLVLATSGDPIVPVNTGIALGRAAGLVEMDAIDPAYGKTDDQVLIQGGVVEGVARLRRYASTAPGTPRALLGPNAVCDSNSDCASAVLLDPSGLACSAPDGSYNGVCTDGLQAPRLSPPLRTQLTRPTHSGSGTAGVAGLLIPYLNRTGQHGFRNPQPQKPFDLDQFLGNVIGRYFETRGTELRFEPCQTELAACPWILPPQP